MKMRCWLDQKTGSVRAQNISIIIRIYNGKIVVNNNFSFISKMQLTVGEKTIEAKVMENEKAEQKYDDQIA